MATIAELENRLEKMKSDRRKAEAEIRKEINRKKHKADIEFSLEIATALRKKYPEFTTVEEFLSLRPVVTTRPNN